MRCSAGMALLWVWGVDPLDSSDTVFRLSALLSYNLLSAHTLMRTLPTLSTSGS